MDIRNKNELRRRIDLFLHDFTPEEYKINEGFCKETMRMMADFIGHVNDRMDSERKRLLDAKRKVRELEKIADKQKWISVNERTPEDGDCRFYMCLVENHIEYVPMMCQFNEEVGFGFYEDIYDPVSLGFVDTEFDTMEDIGYEKVMYWQQLPEPPEEK